jgi:hypothetical protein
VKRCQPPAHGFAALDLPGEPRRVGLSASDPFTSDKSVRHKIARRETMNSQILIRTRPTVGASGDTMRTPWRLA